MDKNRTENCSKSRVASGFRLANAIIAALIGVFFLAHSCMGAFSSLVPSMLDDAPTRIIQICAGCISLHVAASLATSYFMVFDKQRPASDRKKRHLLLKWLTGVLLAALVGVHVTDASAATASGGAVGYLLAAAVAALLGWHLFVGAKSLLKDLRLDSSERNRLVLRIVVVAVCAVVVVLCVFSR